MGKLMGCLFWFSRGLFVIWSSCMKGQEHFTFQTQWMAERLLHRGAGNQVYQGGLLSDVTYRFFANGYLLTTSMFCEQLNRWIPVQCSWIRGLSESYYKSHFVTLFKQLMDCSLIPSVRQTLARQVVDFSLAQREGYIAAYMEVFGEADRSAALKNLKGCHEHYRAQVTRIKNNRTVVGAGDKVEPVLLFFFFTHLSYYFIFLVF